MGKFSWTHNHHKQPSDKFVPIPDWFSKSSAEPSRQALNELVKERLSAEIDSSRAQTVARTRSRSATLASIRSHRAKASSDYSAEIQSRPQSRQSVAEDAPTSPTRAEPVPRNLFSKGSRILRRKTSRLTLLPSQIEEANVEGRRRDPDPSKLDFAAQLLNLSPKRTNIKPNISGPFGFQHVTHTDQGQFQSLNTATKTDLVTEFNAVQSSQQPASEIKGIPVDDLPASSEGSFSPDASRLPSPTSSIMPELATTPPRPQPPPKDSPPPMATPNIRLSRSVENFSRPKRSPTFTADISPISEAAPEGDVWPTGPVLPSVVPSPLSWAKATNDTLTNVPSCRESMVPAHILDKPLPLPPTIVHAVSTADDSALPLRIALLPQLPQALSGGLGEIPPAGSTSAEFGPPTPCRASLRHMLTFPSLNSVRRRSQSSGEMIMSSTALASVLTSPVASQIPKPVRRPSIGIKEIDIEDWEDAIDYSWDYPLDLDDDVQPDADHVDAVNQYEIVRSDIHGRNMHHQANRPLPLTLTPVVEQESSRYVHDELHLQSPTTGFADRASAAAPLQGLGIESFQPATTFQQDIDASPARAYSRAPVRISAIRRDPGSPISKSSSQESIILSIASSIMGTHRSSNSSTSLSDMSHLASIENESPLLADGAKLRAGSKASDSSQDTVTTESQSVSTPSTEFPSPLANNSPFPVHKHARGISLSRVNVPSRTSSIAGARSMPPAGRQRSSTLNGRPKNTRASYSLFPPPQPLPV